MQDTSYSHTPLTNQATVDTHFEQRNQLLLEKRRNLQQIEGVRELEGCTFQPQITKKGREMKPKDTQEISYGDFMRK